MEYLIRFTQVHESFRLPEIEALALLEGIAVDIISYSQTSPFCIVKLPSEGAAKALVRRSILAKAIYELWGSGSTYENLYKNLQDNSQHLWHQYKKATFKFVVDSFQGSRSNSEQRDLINSFKFLAFEGPIRMKNPEQEFQVFEEWKLDTSVNGNAGEPLGVHLGRFVGGSDRDSIGKYDLKKRKYICTTSMDSELALITANITLAAPGKLFYDPFVGSGSFPVACSHFGALSFGSDIDGRTIRGKGKKNLLANFAQYGLINQFGDSFVADLTNTPLRTTRLFDGIVCDPPYGVREGLKVLGNRDPAREKGPVIKNGIAHHTQEDYIPPKKPYSFLAMLDDILDFAALSLVDNGRLSFWMPTANDEDQEIEVPTHHCLQITSICTQNFNKWSRRLITYRRLPDSDVAAGAAREVRVRQNGVTADDLNPFRKGYFHGFRAVSKIVPDERAVTSPFNT